MITPRTNEEAYTGKATLISAGDILFVIAALRFAFPEEGELIEKFLSLRDA